MKHDIPKFMDVAKAVIREKFMATNVYIKNNNNNKDLKSITTLFP